MYNVKLGEVENLYCRLTYRHTEKNMCLMMFDFKLPCPSLLIWLLGIYMLSGWIWEQWSEIFTWPIKSVSCYVRLSCIVVPSHANFFWRSYCVGQSLWEWWLYPLHITLKIKTTLLTNHDYLTLQLLN